MKIYNTLSKKVEEFTPWSKEKVTMYTCGPTVYSYAHIGNLRTYIMEDVLEKTLTFLGYNVQRCMNITDVGHLTSDADTGDDKMVKSAKKENKTVLDIAKYYTDKFKEDFEKLNNKWPEIVSPATKNIDDYIKIIETLLNKGYAYKSGGNIYFDTSKLDSYYKLTNDEEESMAEGVRETVNIDNNKKNKNDFVLWFTKSKFDEQELKWDSPFGYGYPGWHIECTGISIKNLGEYLDIHCGGVDNILPHHTNEIAQSESFLGHKWCNYWVHGEHLLDKNGKMSKSKGEFLTVSLLEEKNYNPLAYRFMCLMSHYRNQLVFTYEALDNASNSYKKLKNKILNLKDEGTLDQELYNKYINDFKDQISNDLNTSNTITLIYNLLKETTSDKTKLEIIKEYDKVLSLDLTINKIIIDEEYVLSKIEERNIAKQNKDYVKADSIRNELLTKGIKLIDTKEGTTYEL